MKTPYQQGFDAGANPPPLPECPYAERTSEYEAYMRGFGDGIDAFLDHQNYDDPYERVWQEVFK